MTGQVDPERGNCKDGLGSGNVVTGTEGQLILVYRAGEKVEGKRVAPGSWVDDDRVVQQILRRAGFEKFPDNASSNVQWWLREVVKGQQVWRATIPLGENHTYSAGWYNCSTFAAEMFFYHGDRLFSWRPNFATRPISVIDAFDSKYGKKPAEPKKPIRVPSAPSRPAFGAPPIMGY
jgi:hypothetical protein